MTQPTVSNLVTTTNGRHIVDSMGNPIEQGDALGAPLISPSGQRWATKAAAYAAGWTSSFQSPPTIWNVVLGLSVAQHETYCGDAWQGEHNWGAVQLGGLSPDEKQCLSDAGLTPSAANLVAARAALVAANLSRVGGALHIDTSPIYGHYFAWFRAFTTDEAGAAFFVKVLAGATRPGCRAALESSLGSWTGDAQALAQAMYDTHYYEGFHDPRKPGGPAANVADYASAILALAPTISLALLTQKWTPPSGPQFDLSSTMGVQSALTFLAGKMGQHSFDPLGVDNIAGKNTIAAIRAFQSFATLPETGTMDDNTRNAIQAQLNVVLNKGKTSP
jgi:hypothetical protein